MVAEAESYDPGKGQRPMLSLFRRDHALFQVERDLDFRRRAGIGGHSGHRASRRLLGHPQGSASFFGPKNYGGPSIAGRGDAPPLGHATPLAPELIDLVVRPMPDLPREGCRVSDRRLHPDIVTVDARPSRRFLVALRWGVLRIPLHGTRAIERRGDEFLIENPVQILI